MKSLWNSYSSLHQSCYSIPIQKQKLFGEDYNTNCWDFIEQHFIKGHKNHTIHNLFFEEDFWQQYEKNGKHVHMVDLYLMGILAEEILKVPIEQDVTTRLSSYSSSMCNFKHLWYLTCFYHDVASCIEKGFSEPTDNSLKKGLQYSLKQSHISSDPYNCLALGSQEEKRKKKKLAENYFIYRRDRGATEHGIVAGYLFYDNLVKTWKKKREKANADVFLEDNVIWRKEYIDLFALLSEVIIRHNMWTAKEGSKTAAVYREYGLDDLIISDTDPKKNRISFHEQPLHFLFYLLDSIEPIKRFEGNAHPRRILENIFICFQSECLTIGWTADLEGIRGFSNWRKSIEELPDWLYVSLSDCWNNARIREQRITFL